MIEHAQARATWLWLCPSMARLSARGLSSRSHGCGRGSLSLPLKTPFRIGRTSAHPGLLQSAHFTASCSRTTNIMSKSSDPSAIQSPPKWQLVSSQKKDEQYARIPHEWRLASLPLSHVTNYIDIPRKCGILTSEEIRITEEYDATALAEAIRSRKLKCVDVTRAFCKVCSSSTT